MSVLCDRDIMAALDRGDIVITPRPMGELIQPASVDLALGDKFLLPMAMELRSAEGFKVPDHDETGLELPQNYLRRVSFANGRPNPLQYLEHKGSIVLKPGQFVLGCTFQKIEVNAHHVVRIEGKSTIGRLGLLVHVSAGFVDPGFSGHLTLELANLAPYEIELVPRQFICQISIHRLSGVPMRTYGDPSLKSRYQNQDKTTEPR